MLRDKEKMTKKYPDQKDDESLVDYHIRTLQKIIRWDEK